MRVENSVEAKRARLKTTAVGYPPPPCIHPAKTTLFNSTSRTTVTASLGHSICLVRIGSASDYDTFWREDSMVCVICHG